MADLLGAMAMEKEYRKLQTDWEAKTAFGYHEKLQAFGFADTVEYEQAKKQLRFSNLHLPYEQVDITELADKRQQAVDSCTEVIHLITGSGVFIYAGDHAEYNQEYCEQNDIFTFVYPGGSVIVANEHDLAISIISKVHDVHDLLLNRLCLLLQNRGLNCNVDGNDILVNGKKIIGSAGWRDGCVSLYNFQISFVVNKELIETICYKPMEKEPMGISEISNVTRQEVANRIIQWLR
jgi:lipoate-protein ligase A